ncbi:hypothetical protein GOARA_060_00090 [Gordonia araii NBRC 100433]|uniref:Phosphoglycerate mutase family protein n=1 Tax=Gordonia araii NBRC 100433 TaxID=1073574 RepID=G7H3Y3_9ACTN|nr:histidine phosphatase family protein [Gordonia araii]NNG98919.1 histidine phosphatase family protein [Gordonia araii NBRC 100433]GAB10558.1 hypothetical protein GOARA_060_00090 [Gordonia araii NBRC 100433]
MSRELVVAGRTGPNHLVRFGETATPLDDHGRRDISALGQVSGPVVCGPELATRESASLLSAAVTVDDDLATLDVGRWTGLLPEQIPGAELAAWFADPRECPHGGETVAEFVARIKTWGRGESDVLVVAGPVAQALLCDDASAFFASQVVPGRRYLL